MTTREQLRELVDQLPEDLLPSALELLQGLAAGEDDEPLTPEDIAAIEEAEEDIRQGRVTPWEQVKAELGL